MVVIRRGIIMDIGTAGTVAGILTLTGVDGEDITLHGTDLVGE